jgi:hypothetical protein
MKRRKKKMSTMRYLKMKMMPLRKGEVVDLKT